MALPNMKHEEKITPMGGEHDGKPFPKLPAQSESTAVAKIEPLASLVRTKVGLPAIRSEFKIKRRLTVPLLKQGINETVCVRFETPYVKADDRLDEVTGEIQKGPNVAYVTDLKTGEYSTYIVNAVTRNVLDKVDGGYVGKSFHIEKNLPVSDRPVGRRFCQMDIYELE